MRKDKENEEVTKYYVSEVAFKEAKYSNNTVKRTSRFSKQLQNAIDHWGANRRAMLSNIEHKEYHYPDCHTMEWWDGKEEK